MSAPRSCGIMSMSVTVAPAADDSRDSLDAPLPSIFCGSPNGRGASALYRPALQASLFPSTPPRIPRYCALAVVA
jgi:hypothetical protein